MGYLVGRGIADITGEVAECGLLGYGMDDQQAAGLHTRLRARAFAFQCGEKRVMLIVCDLPLVFSGVVQAVLRRIPAGYTESNVMVTATHTHCGPGGYSHHALYNGNAGGFRPQTFQAIVDGIVEAATRAHADLSPATLRLARGELRDASANRARRAFDLNPASDREHFPDAVDPLTTLLRVERDGALVGAVNWFAVHNTSMTNRNRLVSSDNKGYAAYFWERVVEGCDYLAETEPDVITAFAQTNAGDMSPNLRLKPGSGPTEDMFENTRIIGTRQSEAARALAGKDVEAEEFSADNGNGGLDCRFTHVDMAHFTVDARFTGDGREHETSGPFAGATAFAGALPDGPSQFTRFHHDRNPLLDTVSRRLVYRASKALADSQAPKTFAFPGRLLNRFLPLVQTVLPVQLIRIGGLYLVGLPFEVTITAGLRLRRTVAGIVGTDVEHVLVVGYSNAYGHYTTTPEEYDAQMYEGASTLFGRWQLPALQQIVSGLAEAMRDGRGVERGIPAPDLSGRKRKTSRRRDAYASYWARDVGQPLSFGRAGRDGRQVSAEFVAIHPSNDLRRGDTYLEIQRLWEDGEWVRVADDGDWSTRFHWSRVSETQATVRIQWDIPTGTPKGRYRIRYLGDDRTVRPSGVIGSFAAASEEFDVG